MKKHLGFALAAILFACCLGLPACGGSSGGSPASSDAADTSASENGSASAAGDSESASADSSAESAGDSASSAAASDVSPELEKAAENLVALADEQAALVEKAKAEGGFEAVEAEWNELKPRVDEATAALKPWAEKYADGSLSDADKSYYMKVVVPAASKSAGAGLELLDLIEY